MNRKTILIIVLIYYTISLLLTITSIILNSPQAIFAYNLLLSYIILIILAIINEHYY
jgi:hypothetical protein